MKHFPSILLAGLMVHFLPLNAEDVHQSPISALVAENEDSLLSSLDEELSSLDQEFEEFDQELSAAQDAATEDESPSIALEQTAPAEAELQDEEIVQLEQLPVIEESPVALQMEPASDFQAEPEVLPIINDYAPSFEISAEKELDVLPVIDEIAPVLEAKADTQLTAWAEEELQQEATATFTAPKMAEKNNVSNTQPISVDLEQAFAGAPIIYSLLLAMSVFSVFIWLYSVYSMRASTRISSTFLKNVQNKLNSNHFDDVLSLCSEKRDVFCKMLSSGIHTRRHGLPVMIEAMKAEGKRSTTAFWQKIGILNDIAIIAPMLGLLGTVLGMFYAFYDVNRSMESISTLFDGLGVSVGTTVAGIIVAILALILHSTAKYRLVSALANVENEAQSVAVLIDDRTSIHKG